MSDSLYVNNNGTPVPLNLGTGIEYVERIEALEVQNAAQDAAIAGKLSTSGGTMTGPIVGSTSIAMRSPNSSGRLLFMGGTSTSDGAYLGLYGADNGSVGRAVLSAVKGSATTSLTVKTNGTASINSNDILTSAGGSLSGKLSFSVEEAVTKKDNASILRICGATSYTNGGCLVLCGKDNNNKGAAELQARDGSNINVFRVFADGSATLNSTSVITLVASWSDGSGNWYRKYSDGWIEQGGKLTCPSGGGKVTTTLHQAFTDANYCIQTTPFFASGAAYAPAISTQTKTNFSAYYHQAEANIPAFWYACGY